MSGRRRLRAGLTRLLPDHRSEMGVALRREYRRITEALGLTIGSTLGPEVTRAAFARVRADEAAKEWAALVERRRIGRGRRPSPRAIERARRAAALDDATATAAYDRLRELAPPRKADLASRMAEHHRGGQGTSA